MKYKELRKILPELGIHVNAWETWVNSKAVTANEDNEHNVVYEFDNEKYKSEYFKKVTLPMWIVGGIIEGVILIDNAKPYIEKYIDESRTKQIHIRIQRRKSL